MGGISPCILDASLQLVHGSDQGRWNDNTHAELSLVSALIFSHSDSEAKNTFSETLGTLKQVTDIKLHRFLPNSSIRYSENYPGWDYSDTRGECSSAKGQILSEAVIPVTKQFYMETST